MNLFINLLFPLYLTCSGHSDISKRINKKCFTFNNVSIKKSLPIYDGILCIDELLKQIVIANCQYYDPKKYFYILSFKKSSGKRYLVIETGQFNESRVFDYIGIIKICDYIFLCRGDIKNNSLFIKRDGMFLEINLQKSKASNEFNYGIEPSLQGIYQECKGKNIYLEIYTRAKLPDYKMDDK